MSFMTWIPCILQPGDWFSNFMSWLAGAGKAGSKAAVALGWGLGFPSLRGSSQPDQRWNLPALDSPDPTLETHRHACAWGEGLQIRALLAFPLKSYRTSRSQGMLTSSVSPVKLIIPTSLWRLFTSPSASSHLQRGVGILGCWLGVNQGRGRPGCAESSNLHLVKTSYSPEEPSVSPARRARQAGWAWGSHRTAFLTTLPSNVAMEPGAQHHPPEWSATLFAGVGPCLRAPFGSAEAAAFTAPSPPLGSPSGPPGCL